MARVNFPVTFLEGVELFKKVKAKHVADGAGSPLNPYIAEQGISFATDQTAVDDAVSANSSFDQLEKDAEKFSEKRDSLFNAVFKDHKNCVQFLKKFYRTNLQRLGDWGVTVNERGRITYAEDFLGKHDEVIDFIDKHDSFAPGTSPLEPFLTEQSIVMATNRTKANDAKTAHEDFQNADVDSETEREERDTKWATVENHLHGIASFLTGLYPNAPHKLGDWGYTVDTSDQGTKEKTVLLKEGQHKTIYNIVSESILKNTGLTSLTIYPGKVNLPDDPANLPPPIVLPAGQYAIAKRGFYNITIDNGSLTLRGTLKVEVSK